MWLTWQQAAWLALGCAAVYAATARLPSDPDAARWVRDARAGRLVIGEVGIIAGLYALWQYVFALTVTRTAGAMEHARSIHHLEEVLGLPSERTVQQLTMRSRALIESLNQYYAYVHIPALGIMLVWLFFRHRGQYPRFRNVLALSTAACLAIQSIPVAPPRFFPGLGFVDTGLVYGQSVYGAGGSGISNQLAAMPSVHVLWSTLVAVAVIIASSSRWRWLIVAHPVITVWAVVATGNHWWADAIVSVAILAVAFGLVEVGGRTRARLTSGAPEPDRGDRDRAPVGVGFDAPFGSVTRIGGRLSSRGSG